MFISFLTGSLKRRFSFARGVSLNTDFDEIPAFAGMTGYGWIPRSSRGMTEVGGRKR